jgi:hypothetical protein
MNLRYNVLRSDYDKTHLNLSHTDVNAATYGLQKGTRSQTPVGAFFKITAQGKLQTNLEYRNGLVSSVMSTTTIRIPCADLIRMVCQIHSHAQTMSYAPLIYAGKYNGAGNLLTMTLDGR